MNYKQDFEINRVDFSTRGVERVYSEFFAINNWPIVYILSDGGVRKAYVGETLDVSQRMATHLKTEEKSKLREAHFISSKKFNKSATLYIESNLIKFLQADGKYKLLNGNLGLGDHSFYQRDEYYSPLFKEIWNSLISKGVAQHSLEHISNSDLFKYSPYKTLSSDQKKNLMIIIEALLASDKKSVLIEGGAGTGKTILAIFLFKLILTSENEFNYKEFGEEEKYFVDKIRQVKLKYPRPKMGLVIAMSSFRQTIKKVFKNVEGLHQNMVIGPSDLAKGEYDILLVDEAHRLRKRVNLTNYKSFDDTAKALGYEPKETNELEWVEKQSKKSLYFYDPKQSIKPTDVNQEDFDRLKAQDTSIVVELFSQFRSKGGNGYVDFINQLLDQTINKSFRYLDDNYEVLLYDSFSEFVDELRRKNEKYSLCRFVAGYGWKWNSKNDKSQYDIEIDGLKFQWNHTNIDYISEDINAEQIGCIHTTQGYDLNYVGVIFGPEIIFNPNTKEIEIVRENYHDKNGLNTITDPEVLKQYIINIYKTIMLRGILGSFVYVCDDNLKNYFRNHMKVFGDKEVYNQVPNTQLELDLEEIELIPFENSVPLYSLQVAAGNFFVNDSAPDIDLYPVPEGVLLSEDHFACRIIGNSMSKIIEDGQVALFRKYTGGTRNGKMVLVEYYDYQDPDFNSAYTFKEYYSDKIIERDGWKHKRIILKPKSYDSSYVEIEIPQKDLEDRKFSVIGVFERVLE